MSDADGIREILNIVNGTRDAVQSLTQRLDVISTDMTVMLNKIESIDKKVDAIARKLDDFSADTQDEFSIIKARLRKLEREDKN